MPFSPSALIRHGKASLDDVYPFSDAGLAVVRLYTDEGGRGVLAAMDESRFVELGSLAMEHPGFNSEAIADILKEEDLQVFLGEVEGLLWIYSVMGGNVTKLNRHLSGSWEDLNLRNVVFDKTCNIRNAYFKNCVFGESGERTFQVGADLSGCTFTDCDFRNTEAALGVIISDATFIRCDFRGFVHSFSAEDLLRAEFVDCVELG